VIHFFPRFSKNAENSPLGAHLRATGTEFRIFGAQVQQKYRYRFQLLLIGYPLLAWSALVSAVKSMVARSGPPPDVVVISSDVEVLVFALVRLLPFAARPRVVFVPFIFTERAQPVINRLRLAYYRFVMRFVSCAICHSRLEVERYGALFAGCGASFVYVPWGTYVPPMAEILQGAGPLPSGPELPVVVAAGRSGRDYPTLVKAAAGLECRVVIVCNEVVSLGGVLAGERVEILTDCFGLGYLWQLMRAAVVVVPLRVADISAGQMVMIQAMALGRPLIVTWTPTVSDYLEDGVNAVLVPRGDAAAMEAAISALLADPAKAAAMGLRAQADYRDRFSGEAHIRLLVRAIEGHLAAVGG
jgi:glycosyltransferase involved in cell wall biosynthesis